MTDVEILAQRVQSLPPEVFNIIYLEVFTPDHDATEIHRNYQPPKLLSINRVTRDVYAKAHYGGYNSSFIFRVPGKIDLDLAIAWLKSLTPAHLSMLRELKFIYYSIFQSLSLRKAGLSEETLVQRRMKDRLRVYFAEKATENGIQIDKDRIVVEFRCSDQHGK